MEKLKRHDKLGFNQDLFYCNAFIFFQSNLNHNRVLPIGVTNLKQNCFLFFKTCLVRMQKQNKINCLE